MDNNSEELNEGYRDVSNMLMGIGFLVLLLRGLPAWCISSELVSGAGGLLVLVFLFVGSVAVSVGIDLAFNETSRGAWRIIYGGWVFFVDVVILGMELAAPTKAGFYIVESVGPPLWILTGDPWPPFLWTLGGSLLFIISGVVRLKGWRNKK